MRLTSENLQAAYDFLATCEPMTEWNLPSSEEVLFRIMRSKVNSGLYDAKDGRHRISVSERLVSTTATLLQVMAHEMIHLHEREVGMGTRAEHSEAFLRIAALVCRMQGHSQDYF